MNPAHEDTSSLASLIQQIAVDLAGADNGTLAELRRLHPDAPGGRAFWRIVVTRLEPDLPVGDKRDEALRRWAVILRALATLHGLHNPGQRFGTVLAKAGVSEARLNKLLRVSGEALWDAVGAVTHQLGSAGAPVDLTGFAYLVLSDGRPHEREVRQHIANDYYGTIFDDKKENN